MLLTKLITVSEYMRRAKSLYIGYPEDIRGLDEWAGRVEGLYERV
jgi:hypothetical protein